MNQVITKILVAALSLSCFLTSVATASESIVFYRNIDGEVSQASKEYAKQMKHIASENGYVTLWLTFDSPINVNFDEMTAEEIAEQEAQISAEVDIVLSPLIESNKVWHPATGKFVKGPGCVVRATTAGLVHLLNDERILQITAMDL